LQAAGSDQTQQIQTAFRIAYGRPPDGIEQQFARSFLKTQRELVAGRTSNANVPVDLPASIEPADAAALVDLCHMLINANEFVYLN
jgi:hypothetical protein